MGLVYNISNYIYYIIIYNNIYKLNNDSDIVLIIQLKNLIKNCNYNKDCFLVINIWVMAYWFLNTNYLQNASLMLCLSFSTTVSHFFSGFLFIN